MKIKLQIKLLLYILTVASVIYIASTGYLNYYATRANEKAITKIIRETETNTALKINNSLNKDLSALRALAASVSGTEIVTESQRIEIYKSAVYRFLENNSDFDNIKISWELGLIDPTWSNSFGRRVYAFERGDGSVRYSIADTNLHGDDFSSNYYRTKVNGKEQITGIVSEDPENPNIKPIYKSTILMPVFDNENNFCALVSGDLEVEIFNNMVKNSISYESNASFILTNNGQFAGTSISITGEKNDLMKIVANQFYEVKADIDSTGFANIIVKDTLGQKILLCGTRIENQIFENKWILISTIPMENIQKQTNSQFSATIFIIIIGLFLLGLFIYTRTATVVNFLKKVGNTLEQLAIGNFQAVSQMEANNTEELNKIGTSLNNLKTGLDKAVLFAEEIGKGNLDAHFKPLSENDELGSSLISMRNSLKQASKEGEERQEQDRKANWITEGTAKFGDILREYNNDMADFSFNIISNLVKYVGANQGGLFVVNNDSKDHIFFELTAGYAYNIRKILKKKVEPGVGLIGRCILERESIYISNLPEDYINITSGLGEKSPQYLLIVPFKFNNEIYAVAEIASFNKIEDYKQQFVEEVGNSIASTIATVKINIRTNKLLQELKVQSEELSSQEEEMRQNMEAMRSSQEEMQKTTDEYTQTNEILNTLIILREYEPDGTLKNLNAKARDFFGKSVDAVVNNNQRLYDEIKSSLKTEEENFWLQLRLGRQQIVKKTIKIKDFVYNIVETYSPIQNYYGKIYKILVYTQLEHSLISTEEIINNEEGGEFF